jgi:hypothetical protein
MLTQILMAYVTVSGLAVMFLLARRNRAGWWLSLVNQFVWGWLAFALPSVGFGFGAIALGAVAIHGLIHWRKP